MTNSEMDLAKTVINLHGFIADWFQGTTDIETFNSQLSDQFGSDLVNIQPSGQTLTRKDIIESIYGGYGANPEFRIEISDVVVRWSNNSHALVTYVESQFSARNTIPADNARVSTVLFDISGDTPIWLHIHETACS